MQRLQNVSNAAAKVRPGFGQGSDRFGSGSLSLSMGRPDVRLADPCLSPRHGFEPACCAARCRSPEFWPDPYHCPTNGVRLGSHRPQSRHGITQSHPEPVSTLDLLGLSPIAAGILQLLTACAVAVLWAIALADWLTADQRRQVQLLRIAGHSQASIGRRLGLTPYRVRKLLK